MCMSCWTSQSTHKPCCTCHTCICLKNTPKNVQLRTCETACNGFVHLPGLKLWKMRAKKCIHRCINVITIRHRKQHTPLGFTTITAQRYVCSYHGTKWGDAYLASSSELWGCLAGVLVRISNSSNIVQYNLTHNIIWTEIRNWPQTALAAVKSLLH